MDPELDEVNFQPDYNEDYDEGNTPLEGASDSRSKPKKSKGLKKCPVCHAKMASHVKRHVTREHLPWYYAASTACWQCEEQLGTTSFCLGQHGHGGDYFSDDNLSKWCYLMNGLLHYLKFKLDLDSLDCLLQYAQTNCELPPNSEFSDMEKRMLRSYEVNCGNSDICVHTLVPLNSIASLLHWRVLTSLLCTLTPRDQEEFKQLAMPLSASGFPIRVSPSQEGQSYSLFDSHFHLDQTLVKCGYSTFAELKAAIEPSGDVVLQFGVANYVYPSSWHKSSIQVGGNFVVRTSYGVHPHFVQSESIEDYAEQLEQLLQDPICVGLGEVGMDSTSRCRVCVGYCKDPSLCAERKLRVQEDFLKRVVPLCVRYNKVLILHCRDSGSGEASTRTLRLLKQLGVTDHPIHRHCFSGGPDELEEWVQTCSQVMFGFTATVLRDVHIVEAVRKLSLSKILLESDSPYLPVARFGTNTPWHVLPVAEKLAQIKNVPVSILLEHTTSNAVKLYSI